MGRAVSNGGRIDGRCVDAVRQDVEVMALEVVAPGVDYPGLPGFPEGDTFEGILAQLG